MMKKILLSVLCLVSLTWILTACAQGTPGGSAGTDSAGGTVPDAAPVMEERDGTLRVGMERDPGSLDPALTDTLDGETLIGHLFSGLARWEQDGEGVLRIVPDAAEDLPEGTENEDGTVTYTYVLREGLRWSDGQEVTAGDFVTAWQRAVSPGLAARYHELFRVVAGYRDIWVDEAGGVVNEEARLAVEAPDERTLTVTLYEDVPYWGQLLARAAYMPVREDVVSSDGWAADPRTFVGNGPYTIADWDPGRSLVLEKDPDHAGADAVTMERIEFLFTADGDERLEGARTGRIQLLDAVPYDAIDLLEAERPGELVTVGQMGTYFLCWDAGTEILPPSSPLIGADAERARQEIRAAISLLFDREKIVREIARGGQVPASSLVPLGMTEPDGTPFCERAGHLDGVTGYFDVSEGAFRSGSDAAVEVLERYYAFDEETGTFLDFPPLTYLYNANGGHAAIARYLRSALADVGIVLELVEEDWSAFRNDRRNGGWSLARDGELADYDDPLCFLDLWGSGSVEDDARLGMDAHGTLAMYDLDLTPYGYEVQIEGGTWAQTYDVLIDLIRSCKDETVRYQLLHEAEDLLMSTGCIVPLYWYTDLYLLSDAVQGVFADPLGVKHLAYSTIEPTALPSSDGTGDTALSDGTAASSDGTETVVPSDGTGSAAPPTGTRALPSSDGTGSAVPSDGTEGPSLADWTELPPPSVGTDSGGR